LPLELLGKSLQLLTSSCFLLQKLRRLQRTEDLQRRGGALQQEEEEELEEEQEEEQLWVRLTETHVVYRLPAAGAPGCSALMLVLLPELPEQRGGGPEAGGAAGGAAGPQEDRGPGRQAAAPRGEELHHGPRGGPPGTNGGSLT